MTCLVGVGRLIVTIDPRRRIELTDPDGHVLFLLRLLAEGTRDLPELVATMRGRRPRVRQSDVESALSALDELGWLDNARAPRMLSDEQRERYFSNLAFFDVFTSQRRGREEVQRQLVDAHVLVLGVGGLGSSAVQHLVGLGVGRLTLVDFDTVEQRNFARQYTYTPAQLGQSKVEQVAAWVRAFDPAVRVTALHRQVTGGGMVAELLDDVDFVVSAIDQPAGVDLQVNRACVSAGVPFVRGGLAYAQGLYWSVDPGRSACRHCLETHREAQRRQDTSGELSWPRALEQDQVNRAIGPVAGMLGALVSMEALRYLTGVIAPVAAGTYHLIDFTGDCRITTEPWPRDDKCPVCALAPVSRSAARRAL
ncbi:ThiF family adenylyltransferase [Kutzneria kofuensis]|uniref:HesA/MoeB/ThiF family protein n=1 Tax=Kutzneria kofuensis TaxID=103725 RepID=UPI0031F1C0FF